MPNSWIEFVKEYSKTNKITYNQALNSEACRTAYYSHKQTGGSLSSNQLSTMLNGSYDKKIKPPPGFILDEKLSSKTSKIYYNPETGQTVVAHMGTNSASDWGNNFAYELGGKKLYKTTNRYKEARKVQSRAEKAYGKNNLTTIGHSQGGLQAEMLGKEGKEIITLNKATRPFTNKKKANQYDIRSSNDAVSALNPFQKKSKNDIIIDSKYYNPLKEHGIDVLDRYEGNIGR